MRVKRKVKCIQVLSNYDCSLLLTKTAWQYRESQRWCTELSMAHSFKAMGIM